MIRADLRVRALLEAGRLADFALASLRDRPSPPRAVALCASACDSAPPCASAWPLRRINDPVHGT